MMNGTIRAAENPTVGPYRILEVLGEGGMGVVYRGEHCLTGRPVALKTVRTAAETTLAGIRREIHALSRLQHPGVVRIIDHGVSGGLPWYAMDLLEGSTLRSHLQTSWAPGGGVPKRAGTATHTQALGDEGAVEAQTLAGGAPTLRGIDGLLPALLAVIRRLCAPLGFLHGSGIVHRDLKPDNIFLRPDGSPVLVDLGLAGGFSGAGGREELAAEGKLMGSLAYMAPEQTRAELVDARADLYALGCILYECATGRPPFAGASAESLLYQHRNVAPVPPSRQIDGFPPALDQLILKLLEKRPQDRLGYADDVAEALRARGVADDDPPGLPKAQPYLYRPDLAGREDALGALERAFARVRDEGRGGCVFLGGESGVGKTRLAMEAAKVAAKRGLTVIAGQCVAIGAFGGAADLGIAAAPLHPLRPLLLAVADRCRIRGVAEADRLLGRRGKVLSAYEPVLAELPGQRALPVPPPLPPQAALARVLDALAATLFAFAEESPVLLVLDDLQWADELSLAFLRQLSMTDFAAQRVLLVGTYRMEEMRDELASIVRAPGVTGIELGRLSARSVGAMVSGMLALREPPGILVDFLSRQSDGNPFFIAEYLRAAILDGMLTRGRVGAWRLHERGRAEGSLEASLPLPGALSSLIERRLLDLDDRSHALVQWASILGREVDDELLTTTAGLDDDALMEALERLRVRQIFEESAHGRLRFVHDKIRDLAYAQIPEARRRGLHRRAAEAIEARWPEGPDQYPALGHHFAQAGVHERASHYHGRAAERSRAAYANGEAIRHYQAALHEADLLARSGAAAPPALHTLHEGLGDVLALTGRQAEARAAYEGAPPHPVAAGETNRARLLRKVGTSWQTHHEHERALAAYQAAEAALDALTTRSPAWWSEWLQIQMDRCSVHYWRNEIEASAAIVARVRPVLEERATAPLRVQFYRTLLQMRLNADRYLSSVEAVGFARAGLAACREIGTEREVGVARFTLSTVLLWHGALDEAEREMLPTLAGIERLGDAVLLSRCLSYLTMLYRQRRAVAETRAAAERTLSAAETAGMKEYLGVARANLGWCAWQLGRQDEGAREGEAALALWRELRLAFPFEWMARLPLAEVALAEGGVEIAREHARAVLDPQQQRLPDALAEALSAAVAAGAAPEALRRALRLAADLGYV